MQIIVLTRINILARMFLKVIIVSKIPKLIFIFTLISCILRQRELNSLVLSDLDYNLDWKNSHTSMIIRNCRVGAKTSVSSGVSRLFKLLKKGYYIYLNKLDQTCWNLIKLNETCWDLNKLVGTCRDLSKTDKSWLAALMMKIYQLVM